MFNYRYNKIQNSLKFKCPPTINDVTSSTDSNIFTMKRRRPVSYAEDEYSDESEYEEANRNRDIDNNKVRNGRNRESRSGET